MSSHDNPIVFGAPYSVYVQTVRLALEEKGVTYELVPVDIFAPDGPSAAHMTRHPFGKIPAFEHGGFRLYEAAAITRYIDEAFAGPPLQPVGLHDRARMMQIISILDSYAYRTLVWDIYVERIARPATGSAPDEGRISAALPKARICLSALADLMGDASWLAGLAISLADLHAAPIFATFRRAPEGERLLSTQGRLVTWWDRMSARASFVRTQAPPRHVSQRVD
jgi:glutathione S-transferase